MLEMFRERCEAETTIRRKDMKTRDRLFEIINETEKFTEMPKLKLIKIGKKGEVEEV